MGIKWIPACHFLFIFGMVFTLKQSNPTGIELRGRAVNFFNFNLELRFEIYLACANYLLLTIFYSILVETVFILWYRNGFLLVNNYFCNCPKRQIIFFGKISLQLWPWIWVYQYSFMFIGWLMSFGYILKHFHYTFKFTFLSTIFDS